MWCRTAQMHKFSRLNRGGRRVALDEHLRDAVCGSVQRLAAGWNTLLRRILCSPHTAFAAAAIAVGHCCALCVGALPALAEGNGRPPVAATPGAAPSSNAGEADQIKRGETREAQKTDKARQTGNLVGHGGPIKAIAVDAQRERVATGSFDYAMMVWDVSGELPRVLHRFDKHGGAVNAVAFVPGSTRVLAAGDDGALSVWDTATGQLVHRFEGHTAKINHVAVSSDGRFAVTSSWDRTARLWDLSTLTAGPLLEGHGGPVNAAQFSMDGSHVYTACYDGVLRLFNRADGSLARPLYKHGWGLNVLVRVPGSEQIVTGALNGSVVVVDGMSGDVVKELKAFERPVLSAAVIEKPGLLAVGAGDGSVRVVRLADWEEIETYQNPYGPVWALAFAPGATALYYGGLDDFATRWQIRPRASYESVDSPYPRRFQVSGDPNDPVAQGALQFARKCSVCHTLKPDGKNRAGPSLYQLFGRRIASLPGYPYSKGLSDLDIVWTEETVSKLFEQGPEHFTPGSKMPLQKMTDPEQRAALIAFLKVATEPGKDDVPAGGDAAGEGGKRTDNPVGSRDASARTKETKQ